mgnify:CR=1 FL=1
MIFRFSWDARQVIVEGLTDAFLFHRQGTRLPMTPTTSIWRFNCILKKNGLPKQLNVHSLRHTAASAELQGMLEI